MVRFYSLSFTIPLVKLMVVSTSDALLCPWVGGGGGGGGGGDCSAQEADKPAGLHKVQMSQMSLQITKFRCLSKSPLLRPEPRIISLVTKFQEELNQTLLLKMSLTTSSCSHHLLQL